MKKKMRLYWKIYTAIKIFTLTILQLIVIDSIFTPSSSMSVIIMIQLGIIVIVVQETYFYFKFKK